MISEMDVEMHHPIRTANSYLFEDQTTFSKEWEVLFGSGGVDDDVSLLQPHKRRRLECLEDIENDNTSNKKLERRRSNFGEVAGENTNTYLSSLQSNVQSFDIYKVLEDKFDWFQPKTANALYLAEGSTSSNIEYNTDDDTSSDFETFPCDGGGGDIKSVEDYNIFDTLKENFNWFKDGYAPPADDRFDFESRRESEDDLRSVPSYLPCDLTRAHCSSGGNCNCSISIGSSQLSPDESYLIRGKRIRISGSFKAHGISQDDCKSMLLDAGALEVTMHTTSFGDADILLAGIKCGQSLLDDARRKNKLVLTYPQLISRLQHEGYSFNNTAIIVNESELADMLIREKCQFDVVDNETSTGLKLQCITALPKELKSSRVFDNKQLVVEVAQFKFMHTSLIDREGKLRQVKIVVTRIKQKGESVWQYHNKFYHLTKERKRNKWSLFCVQHNKRHKNCGECNSCPHGFGSPYKQCMECCPWIMCMDCGLEPRTGNQSSCGEYTNRCARCYRVASGGMSSEDRSIKYILDSNIPVSSIDKFVFGLQYRPDAEITESPYNDISYECDDERGHDDRYNYPENEQHQRTVELNECRPWEKGKITIRQHPLDITDTVRQEKQNKLLVSTIKEYMNEDLGQREDGQGKRIILFIGHSRSNYHYKKAEEEKESGYWDEVRLLCPYNPKRNCPEPEL